MLLIVAAVLLLIAWLNFRARHSQSVPTIFGKIQGIGPALSSPPRSQRPIVRGFSAFNWSLRGIRAG